MTRKKAFFTGLSFGLLMTIWNIISPLIFSDGNEQINWMKNSIAALVGGVFGGVSFGLIMYGFANSKWMKPNTSLQLKPDEILLFETTANHFKKMESMGGYMYSAGGYLYLTNQNLIFKSHRSNIQSHDLTVPLSDITEVSRYKTIFFTNNGLKITTSKGNTEKFVADDAAEWSNRLTVSQIGIAGIQD